VYESFTGSSLSGGSVQVPCPGYHYYPELNVQVVVVVLITAAGFQGEKPLVDIIASLNQELLTLPA